MGRTVANDPMQKYMFRVSVPGLPAGMGFQKVGGLTKEVGVTEYMEGLYQYTHKLPGREKFSEVTMERGVYASSELEDLYKETLKAGDDMRRTIVISIVDRFGNEKKSWKLAEAWVSKWEGSDMDATSDDVAIEKITFQFEHYL